MSTTIHFETKNETKSYYKPFQMRGNIEGEVKKFKPNLGDGDIYTKDNGSTFASLRANLSFDATTNKVRLDARYCVWENGFNANDSKGGKDYLYFDAVQYFDVSEFVRGGNRTWAENNGTVKKESSSTAKLEGTYQEFYLIDMFKGKKTDWLTPTEKFGTTMGNNSLRPWLPIGDIRMKIDDKGSELASKGSIGVCGYIRFDIKRTDNIKVTTTVEDVVSGTLLNPEKGNETKVTNLPEILDSVLCRGYDICGGYADSDSCRDKVLDFRKLNEYNRLKREWINNNKTEIFAGEGIKEYSSSIEKKINVKVSAHAFGASFSNETSKAFKEDTSTKTGYKYITQKDVFIKEAYTVQGYTTPMQLSGFLTPEFLKDLNSITADQIIVKYGTHVVLGMKTGSNFFYNMKYKESTSKKSTASTFENKTCISYNSDGSVKKDKGGAKETSKTEQIFDALFENGLSADELKAFAEYLKAAQNTTPEKAAENSKSGGGGNGAFSGSAEVAYSQNTANTLLQEDKSTETNCYGHGGNAALLSLISRNNDLSKMEEWIKTVGDSDPCFADFVPGTLVPIYEFVPAGYNITAQALREASDNYQINHSKCQNAPLRGVKRVQINTLGNKNNTDKIQGDWELDSKSGKKILWHVTVELINFDNGHCGYAVSLTVKEGGRTGADSILLNHIEGDLSMESGSNAMAIDTDYFNGQCVFESEVEWEGQFHGWHDATDAILADGSAKMVFDCDSDRVAVQLDGSGDDAEHVGIRGTLLIPWISY